MRQTYQKLSHTYQWSLIESKLNVLSISTCFKVSFVFTSECSNSKALFMTDELYKITIVFKMGEVGIVPCFIMLLNTFILFDARNSTTLAKKTVLYLHPENVFFNLIEVPLSSK